MSSINPKNQFLIEPSRQPTRDFLANGGHLMKKMGTVAQNISILVAMWGVFSKSPLMASSGILASWGFRDIQISGSNMKRLMTHAEEQKAVALNPKSWEEVCCRRTLLLGPYIRYVESLREASL